MSTPPTERVTARRPRRLLRAVAGLCFACAVPVAGQPTAGADDAFLDRWPDSLVLAPRPLYAFGSGGARWGLAFSALKTLPSVGGRLAPYLEAGLSLFDRVDRSPHDKKQLFLRAGCFVPLGRDGWAVSADAGAVYANRRIGAGWGCGAWYFFAPPGPGPQKSPKDFPSYAHYLAWKEKAAGPPLVRGWALGVRAEVAPGAAPGATLGLALEAFF